ncbi:MAG: PCYCGC motif-containing (lipo)protein [Nanoarchaeota archaeon]
MKKENVVILILITLVVGGIAYYFISPKTLATGEIPSYVTGETRAIYEWAKTAEGKALLEQIPCYCGCDYDKHKHAGHCFWRDDGFFDDHGATCSTCLNIGKKTMEMSKERKNICEIRNEIDDFYKDLKHLATETPMPNGCD